MPPPKGKDKWSTWDTRVRNLVIFALGALIVINEIFAEKEPRPTALVAASFLIGIPLTLGADEIRRKNR